MLMASGCGNSHASPETRTPQPAKGTKPTAEPATAPSPATDCANRSPGDACLGSLDAGRHKTTLFSPAFSYRMPSGWSNYHDQSHDFLLGPPGVSNEEAQGGGDYVELFSDLVGVAASRCTEHAATRAKTPKAMARLLRGRPELDVSKPRPTRIGGLRGLVVTLRLAPRWKKGCLGQTDPAAVVLVGIPPSGVVHGVGPGISVRLYLLKRRPRALVIEVDDLRGGRDLHRYGKVVRSVRFAP
jgi:hypothetical protein